MISLNKADNNPSGSLDGLGDLRRASISSISAQMEEYEELLPYLTYQERADLDALLASVYTPIWEPFPGPQSLALDSEADELFYGGAAGGGKTDLLLGSALTRHWRSIIFRREYAELKGIRERAEELYEEIGKFNGQSEIWRILRGEFTGKRVEFGACQYEGDERKFQGRAHDLKGFDEITQFTERQFRFLTTWNRTTRIGQRYRTIATGNPPVSAEGQWVVDYWGPWLNPRHPNPAKQGELRWFLTVPEGTKRLINTKTGSLITGFIPGKDFEFTERVELLCEYEGDIDNEIIEAKSRTFIKARVEDNPRLMETGYRRTLQNLPEPLRSMMLRGDFGVGHEDDEWQIIPTDWIYAAQARWAPTFEEFLIKQEARLRGETVEEAPEAIQDLEAKQTLVRPLSLDRLANTPDGPQGHVPQSNNGHTNNGRTRVPEPPLPQSLLGGSGTDITAFVSKKAEEEKRRPKPLDNVQARKEEAEREGAIGVDVSRGGRDDTIVVERLENWFGALTAVPGKQTQDGNSVVQTLINLGFSGRRIHIDVTGVGTSPVDIGRMIEMNIIPIVNSEKSYAKDRSGKLSFANLRAQYWWQFREALDPVLGDNIALPPDPGLLADLTAPHWSLTARGILVEAKEHIKARLGRSPDKGDAIVNAHATPYIVGEGYLKYLKEQVSEMHKDEASKTSEGATA